MYIHAKRKELEVPDCSFSLLVPCQVILAMNLSLKILSLIKHLKILSLSNKSVSPQMEGRNKWKKKVYLCKWIPIGYLMDQKTY